MKYQNLYTPREVEKADLFNTGHFSRIRKQIFRSNGKHNFHLIPYLEYKQQLLSVVQVLCKNTFGQECSMFCARFLYLFVVSTCISSITNKRLPENMNERANCIPLHCHSFIYISCVFLKQTKDRTICIFNIPKHHLAQF